MAILALAKQLYGASLLAFSVTLAGQSFDHGETLSAVGARGLPCRVTKVEALVRQFLDSTAGYFRIEQDVESFLQGQA